MAKDFVCKDCGTTENKKPRKARCWDCFRAYGRAQSNKFNAKKRAKLTSNEKDRLSRAGRPNSIIAQDITKNEGARESAYLSAKWLSIRL